MDTKKVVEKLSSAASWLGAMAAVIAVASYVFYQKELTFEVSKNSVRQRDLVEHLEKSLDVYRENIKDLRVETMELSSAATRQIETLKEQQQRLLLLASTQKLDPSSQEEFISLVTQRVISKISKDSKSDEMERRIEIIEDVIVQNPEKALQIPFIKNEVANILKSIQGIQKTLNTVDDSLDEIKVYKSQVDSLTNQVNQTNNWMIGIFGALGVSVLGLLIGNLFQRKNAQT